MDHQPLPIKGALIAMSRRLLWQAFCGRLGIHLSWKPDPAAPRIRGLCMFCGSEYHRYRECPELSK